MPLYTYQCPTCGRYDQLGRYDDVTTVCACGQVATRATFYRTSNIIEGQSLPRPEDTASVNDEWGKELKKRGWGKDRVHTELRAARTTDRDGNPGIDMSKMAKEA